MVKRLINQGVDVNRWNIDREYAIHVACKHNMFHIVEVLVNNGAYINVSTSPQKYSPLHYAILYGTLELVHYLVNKKAILNSMNMYQETPLHIAASEGKIDIYNFLLTQGVSEDVLDKYEETPKDILKEVLKVQTQHAALIADLLREEEPELGEGRFLDASILDLPLVSIN